MNSAKTIIITGAGGFIGSHLTSYLAGLGVRVRAFGRKTPTLHDPRIAYHPFDLANIQDAGFAGADYLIHCAHESVLGRGVNVEAAKKIISLCKKHDIRLIFLSSFSAHEDAESEYGREKLAIERLCDPEKDLVLKLGLVLGPGGGLFGKIVSLLDRLPVVPLVGAGSQMIQTLALEDLGAVMASGIEKNISGAYAIAHPLPVSMKMLYEEIARRLGRTPVFVPVSLSAAFRMARLAEALGFHPPITSENVLGLKHLRVRDTREDVARFGVLLKDWRETLDRFLPSFA